MAADRRQRLREIVETLSRHGFGFLVGAFGLERRVPFHHGLLGHERREEPYTQPEHVRLALEELGATFIKLGQIVSTRADLLPAQYLTELAKLQDAAPPVAAGDIRFVIEQELGRPPEDAFATFDGRPLAAASIGQAHAATLADGTEVVVKIRRPGVVEQVEQDLEIFRNLAVHADRHWDAARHYDTVGLADEFAETLLAELDYLREGRNAERFAESFADRPGVHIPRVFWDTTTSRVLTLERIHGINVSDTAALDSAGIDRRSLAEQATRVTAQMIFEDGFFHADPHPGNLFIEPDGRIGIIDFGMVGALDDRLRERLGQLFVALASRDADRLTGAVLLLAPSRATVDRAVLRGDLRKLTLRYGGRSVSELAVASLIEDLLAIIRRHRLQLPAELALMLKMLVMTEGLATRLDPDFQPAAVLGPYARGFVLAEHSPAAIARRLRQAGADTARLGIDLPDQIRHLLDAAASGGLELHLRADELEALARRQESAARRLSVAVLAAAAVNAIATVVAHRRGGVRQ